MSHSAYRRNLPSLLHEQPEIHSPKNHFRDLRSVETFRYSCFLTFTSVTEIARDFKKIDGCCKSSAERA